MAFTYGDTNVLAGYRTVYIQASTLDSCGAITELTTLQLEDTNFISSTLTNFDKIGILANKWKATANSADSIELSDGTKKTYNESISVRMDLLEFTKANYEYVRTTFHNKRCDIFLRNCDSDYTVAGTEVEMIYGVRLIFEKEITNGDLWKISIEGDGTDYDIDNILVVHTIQDNI